MQIRRFFGLTGRRQNPQNHPGPANAGANQQANVPGAGRMRNWIRSGGIFRRDRSSAAQGNPGQAPVQPPAQVLAPPGGPSPIVPQHLSPPPRYETLPGVRQGTQPAAQPGTPPGTPRGTPPEMLPRFENNDTNLLVEAPGMPTYEQLQTQIRITARLQQALPNYPETPSFLSSIRHEAELQSLRREIHSLSRDINDLYNSRWERNADLGVADKHFQAFSQVEERMRAVNPFRPPPNTVDYEIMRDFDRFTKNDQPTIFTSRDGGYRNDQLDAGFSALARLRENENEWANYNEYELRWIRNAFRADVIGRGAAGPSGGGAPGPSSR